MMNKYSYYVVDCDNEDCGTYVEERTDTIEMFEKQLLRIGWEQHDEFWYCPRCKHIGRKEDL